VGYLDRDDRADIVLAKPFLSHGDVGALDSVEVFRCQTPGGSTTSSPWQRGLPTMPSFPPS
jgi:hypothetical protein